MAASVKSLREPTLTSEPRPCVRQFTVGVVGGTYYWCVDLRDVRLRLEVWPPLEYVERCAGGDVRVVFVGYLTNAMLLALFVHFYRRSYRRSSAPRTSKEKSQ